MCTIYTVYSIHFMIMIVSAYNMVVGPPEVTRLWAIVPSSQIQVCEAV